LEPMTTTLKLVNWVVKLQGWGSLSKAHFWACHIFGILKH
jgi:hypothetical protein